MKKVFIVLFTIIVVIGCKQNKPSSSNADKTTVISPDSAKAIAKDAWIYGYPVFYNYKAIYLTAIDKNGPEYGGGFNKFKNYAKSFTYVDTTVVTPNNDTPYSWAALNLSNEPVILEVPEVKNNRYYVMQLVDLYTFNFDYIGTRALGNKAGKYLIAGPDWNGEKPAGVDKVFKAETNLVTILGRTEMNGNAEIPIVKKIQEQYKIIPLHEYLKTPAPTEKKYALPLPVWKESDYKGITFINVLNALMQYTSTDQSEVALRERFAKIGLIPGQPFDSSKFPKEVITAIEEGIKEGEKELAKSVDNTTGSMALFGTRAYLQNNYLKRATAAAAGLYGNTKEEAVYVGSRFDKSGSQLMGNEKYVLKFSKDQIPPVNIFWSITMYKLPQRYLVKNPINRYSIGDKTKGLKFEADGSLIIYMQSSSPGKDKESNWLPTPESGPFNYVVRLYGPKETVTNGTWQQPLPEKVN